MRTLRLMTVVLLGLALLIPVVVAQSQDASKTESSQLPNAPSAQVEPVIKFNVEFGAEAPFFSSGDRWTKFVQYRDIPSNFTVNSLNFSIGRENSRWSLVGSALDAGQLDQRYRLELEKFGISRSSFRYNEWPNFISRGVTSPYAELRPGFFTIPTPIRTAFETAFTGGDVATQQATINDLVANTALSSLKTRRQRFTFDEDFNLTSHWFVNAGAMHERRTGHRPIGLGAYNRSGGALPGGAAFLVFEDELPERVDYRNTEFRAGIGYKADRGMIRFDYTGSWFQNEVKNLVWTNPFEVDPPVAAPPGANRWRFATDQLYTNPDNRAHTLTFTGRVKLPADSFFSALLAYSMRRQDSPFDQFSLNGATSAVAGFDVTNPANLSQRSLNGEVNTTTGDAALGTRHWKTVSLTAHYRAFNLDNQDKVLALAPAGFVNGMVNMGSFWTTNFDGAPVTAFQAPSSYLRQNASVEAVWRPMKEFQLRVAPTLETWNRSFRQVVRMNEWGADSGIIVKPVNWVNGKVTYRYGNRIPESTYVPAQNEFVDLRMFDQAHRITHNPAIVLNFGGKGPWLVSANYTYMSQVYDKNFFGLSNNRRGAAGLDVNYAPSDRWGVVAYYNHERIGSAYRSAAKELDPPLPASFAGNEWDRSTRDVVDSFGVGFNLLSSDQKWQFSVNYDFSLANERISTTNPLVPANPLDATGRPFPDIKSRFHEVFVDTSYGFRPNWKAGVRYIFSPYRLQDFTTDNIAPYMPTQSATAVPGTVDPQIVFTPAGTSGSLKFLLLNSKYASADAHMMGVYIRYTF